MKKIHMRSGLVMRFMTGTFLVGLVAPEFAVAQCLGASAVQDFASNMKGCAVTVSFAARAATCAPGWHVCTSAEWTGRFAGQTPKYSYWTNDDLKYGSADNGCFASVSTGNSCSTGTTMHVCAPPTGDRDGAYATASRYHLLQTFLPDGSISLVTSVDVATGNTRSYLGSLSANAFSGGQIGGNGALVLQFQTGDTGSDGSAPFTKFANAVTNVDRFTRTTDPLGNSCNWHNCGVDSVEPNLYFGGCNDSVTAGVLCCQ